MPALISRRVLHEHSPPRTRVNEVLRNMDAWYAAFGVGEEDPLFIAPADRMRIW